MSTLTVKPANSVPPSSRGSKYVEAVDQAVETLKTEPAAVVECEDAKQATNVAASLKSTIAKRDLELTVSQRGSEVYITPGKQPVIKRKPRTPKKEAVKKTTARKTARRKPAAKTTDKPAPTDEG